MQKLLRRVGQAVNATKRGQQPHLKASLIALFDRRYDAITSQGLHWHESQPPLVRAGPARKPGRQPHRTGHNLLKRLSEHKQDVLRVFT